MNLHEKEFYQHIRYALVRLEKIQMDEPTKAEINRLIEEAKKLLSTCQDVKEITKDSQIREEFPYFADAFEPIGLYTFADLEASDLSTLYQMSYVILNQLDKVESNQEHKKNFNRLKRMCEELKVKIARYPKPVLTIQSPIYDLILTLKGGISCLSVAEQVKKYFDLEESARKIPISYLLMMPKKEIRKLKGVGTVSMKKLEDILAEFDLYFDEDMKKESLATK